MSTSDTIRIGVVGAAGRGGSFRRSIETVESFQLVAACDTNLEAMEKADWLRGVRLFSDYEAMLGAPGLDAVVIGTPMPLHAAQSIAALERGLHVLCEVPAVVSVAEAKQLVAAAKASRGIYMLAENYTYIQSNQVLREMVRRGEFGTPYYAEGEYIHELKELNEVTRWRRKWQTGIAGITYGTHSLGPILQWMPGDRVVSVCCAGAGHHHKDPRGDHYENDESTVMLCKMANGGLVKIRVDMLSDRPHAMTNYQLQGTNGAYESARSHGLGEKNRIWLRSKSPTPDQWIDLESIQSEYMPEAWVKFEERAKNAGHGGGDLLELVDFADAIQGKRPCPIGLHEAMDMTLPGLVSQQSILEGGRWIEVPDSRSW